MDEYEESESSEIQVHAITIDELIEASGLTSEELEMEMTGELGRDTEIPGPDLNQSPIVPDVASEVTISAVSDDGDQQETPSSSTELQDVQESNSSSNKRKRSRKPKSEEWSTILTKKLRMEGKPYIGYQRENKKVTHGIRREARTMGIGCTGNLCARSAIRHCNSFSEEARQTMFDHYWNDMNWDQRKVYVGSLVNCVNTKRSKHSGSRRAATLKCHLRDSSGVKTEVCKKMFLATFAIGEWSVRNWASKSTQTFGSSPCTAARKQKRSSDLLKVNPRIQHLRSFLDQLAKMPSHYCRQRTTKLYLEPIVNSKAELYKLYKNSCQESKQQPLCSASFGNEFDSMNLSLFQPKKDQCDTCCGFKTGNVDKLTYDYHIKRKTQARAEKDADKVAATQGSCRVLTMDMESVKLSPSLKASALYYRTKLIVHNFSIFNLSTLHCTCFWFNEAEAGLEASVYATCMIRYIEEQFPDCQVPIILFSDGCTAQNRNAIVSNALLHYSMKHGVVIIQKYLEKGHTQMECDSVHAAIERRLKDRDIYLPIEYVQVSKEARTKPFPYDVKYLTFDYFLDYSKASEMRYNSIRPGRKTGDSVVTDIRALKYEPNGIISYKLDFSDEWKDLPRRPKPVETQTFSSLYVSRQKIQPKKWIHLQELKSVLPRDAHSFYDSLPH